MDALDRGYIPLYVVRETVEVTQLRILKHTLPKEPYNLPRSLFPNQRIQLLHTHIRNLSNIPRFQNQPLQRRRRNTRDRTEHFLRKEIEDSMFDAGGSHDITTLATITRSCLGYVDVEASLDGSDGVWFRGVLFEFCEDFGCLIWGG